MGLMWLYLRGEVRVGVRQFGEVVRNKMENFGEGRVPGDGSPTRERASEGRYAIVKSTSVDSDIFYHREVSPGLRHGLPS